MSGWPVGGGPPGRPPADGTRSFLEASGRAWLEGAELPVAIAIPAKDGWQLVGTAGLRINWYTQGGAAWYWIDAVFEGRGLVSRPMTNLLDQAFGPLGLARVTVHTEAANQRSRAVAARLGLTEEGLHPQAIAIRDQRREERGGVRQPACPIDKSSRHLTVTSGQPDTCSDLRLRSSRRGGSRPPKQ